MQLQKTFKEIEDVTVHVDTEDHPESLPDKMLPTRTELMSTYMPLWEKRVKREQILHVTLYYLRQKIQIEVVLALQVLDKHQATTLQKQFANTITQDQQIESLTLFFQ